MFMLDNSANMPTNNPGSISLLSGAHSTYHVRPPETREVHGRSSEKKSIDDWYKSEIPMFVLSGIAGCGKTTLVSFWIDNIISSGKEIQAMYYPCQPWDSSLGIATDANTNRNTAARRVVLCGLKKKIGH